jgi:hypothetical protein
MKECTFKPKTSSSKNNNTNNNSNNDNTKTTTNNFLHRMDNFQQNIQTRLGYEQAKEDYLANKLINLYCPKCGSMQSYDQYIEKRRYCEICQLKFTKKYVCKLNNWESRQKENEQKKARNLAKIRELAYNELTFEPKM